MVGGAGAATAFAAFLAACGDDDDDQAADIQDTQARDAGAGGDLEIVQYALTLEHLETDFYNAVIDAGVIKDAALAKTATMIRDNEQEHVDALTAVNKQLGGTGYKRPKTTFDAVLDGGPAMILETAATVENLGAAAYLGQAGRIKSKDILASALAIHSVEGRHAAALNTLVGQHDRARRRLRQAGLDGGGAARGAALPRQLARSAERKENFDVRLKAGGARAGRHRRAGNHQAGAHHARSRGGRGRLRRSVRWARSSRESIAQDGGGDVEILNFALTLEYLEAAFYESALKQRRRA